MTGNDKEFEVIKSGLAEDGKEGLEIIEEDAFDSEPSNEKIEQFYEENKDAIDLIGGLDLFESLLQLNDEDFSILKPQMITLFISALNEPETKQELQTLALARNYTAQTAKEDFDIAAAAINEIDFLSNIKKDFLKELYTIICNKLQDIINNTNQIIHIPCELEEDVQLPTYAHETDAGLDIYAREEIIIEPGETKILNTGIKAAIPEGYALLIQPRSGQSVKTKLRIANTPGLIDSGYRDDIGVIIENIEPPFKDIDYEFDDNGEIHIKSIIHGLAYTITKGQRFAQMRLVQVPKAEFIQVESVGEIGEDRGGGFGSSGN